MSSRRTLILIAAIAVGAFAGIALLSYIRGVESGVYQDAQPVQVLIAATDIPKGTPAADALQSVELRDIPLEIRPSSFIPADGTDELAGLVANSDIPRNQIIIRGLFVDPTVIQQSFKDQIPTGQVAVSVSVAQVRAVGGYLQPGDEVNIMVNDSAAGCAAAASAGAATDIPTTTTTSGPQSVDVSEYCSYTQPARYIFQRVKILAIGDRQTLQPGQTSAVGIVPMSGTITFMAPNEAAQIIASLDPSMMYLTLLPEDYQAEPLPALSKKVIQGPTPAETPECLTPYGVDGYVAGDAAAAVSDLATTTDTTAAYSCSVIWGE